MAPPFFKVVAACYLSNKNCKRWWCLLCKVSGIRRENFHQTLQATESFLAVWPPDGKNPAVVLDASLFEPGSMWEPIQSYNASNYILPGSFWFESYNERIENSFPYSAMKNLGVIIEYWNSVCMVTSKHFSYGITIYKSQERYTYAYTGATATIIHWHDSNNYGMYA